MVIMINQPSVILIQSEFFTTEYNLPQFKNSMEKFVFLTMLVLVSLALLWIVKPFLGAVFWAIAITILMSPYQNRFLPNWQDKPNRKALLTLTAGLLLLIIPVVLLGIAFTAQILNIMDAIKSGELDPTVYFQQIEANIPFVGTWLDKVGVSVDNIAERLKVFASDHRQSITQYTLDIGQNAFSFILNFSLMLYLIFFFLRDGQQLTNMIIRAFPMSNHREKNLLNKISTVIQATIKGNFVVAAIQGGLGGIIFWILGISAPLLWGVVMVFASLLPAVGAAIVWGPVAIYLLLTGAYIKGAILIIVGAGAIGLVDNFLRPILVGKQTGLPDYMVLLTTLGGLSVVGLNGFVVGPLIAALFVSVWGIFMQQVKSASDDE